LLISVKRRTLASSTLEQRSKRTELMPVARLAKERVFILSTAHKQG